ncbi:unnamed protein product [Didymodactylos carnosus]|uniref:Uncharacterized protein n=1 Tax=Didymodactylos carnosus TaxID=1234261 RepID=A0A815F659_9BILA|nr:unnamed protein product [Didymodactylos carnosus]CAF4167089.1 unnamed protein product [Didymodactylos carnosus]
MSIEHGQDAAPSDPSFALGDFVLIGPEHRKLPARITQIRPWQNKYEVEFYDGCDFLAQRYLTSSCYVFPYSIQDDSLYQSYTSDIPLSNSEDERTLPVDADSTDLPTTEAEIDQLTPVSSLPTDKPLVSASDEYVDSLAGLSDIFCERDPYEVFYAAVADAAPILNFHAIKLHIDIEGIEPPTLSLV